MVGAIRLAYCACGATPPIIVPPVFPGAKKITAYGTASSYGQAPSLYATGTGYTPCYSTPLILYSGFHAINLDLESNMTREADDEIFESQTGSYSSGIVQKIYNTNLVTFSNLDYSEMQISTNCIPAAEYGVTQYPCGTEVESVCLATDNYSKRSDGGSSISNVVFGWLGVAQRDLPGIRVQRISGTKKWLVSVDGGVIEIYAEDGSESFSTSGTLKQVASAINASSIGSKISARCSGWQTGFGETGGTVPSGYNQFDYVYTENDPSTILKDLGPIYIQATFCNDTYAPSGWRNSTRLPVYFRGETLPPRGIVYLGVGSFQDAYSGSYYINSKFDFNPQLKLYENTEDGALAFITDPIYSKTQTAQWGTWNTAFGFAFSGSWNAVFYQINRGWYQQSRFNPGVSQYQENIASSWYGDLAGETVTQGFGNIELLGTCYGDPGGQFCPYDTPPPCPPGDICSFGPYQCTNSGCYDQFPIIPCAFGGQNCTVFYEYINPANYTVLSYTYPSILTFRTSTSFYVQIS